MMLIFLLLQQGWSKPQRVGVASSRLITNGLASENKRVKAIRTALVQQEKMLHLQLQQYETLKKIRIEKTEDSVPIEDSIPIEYAFKRSQCSQFPNMWNGALMHLSRDLWRELNRTLTNHNIDYSLAGATALGFSREGTFIPWNTKMTAVVAKKAF